jgi:hypothetical protein
MTAVVAVRAADYAQLAQFLATFPGETYAQDFWIRRFATWWDDNPAFDEGCVRGWVVRDDQGNTAGFIGNVPSLFQLQRRELRVFGGTTYRVLPANRNSSVRLYLAQIAAQGSALLFNTTPNPGVERVLDYLQFRSLPSHRSGRRFLVAIDPGRAMRAHLRSRLEHLPDAIAGVPLALAQLPLRYRLRGAALEVRILQRADEAFDDLWSRTRDRYANTSIRSAAQVQWMCFANADARRTLLGCYAGGSLSGFAIFGDTLWRGTRVLDLVDLWTDGPRHEVARALLAAVWEYARKHRHAVVALYDYQPGDAELFRDLGIFLTLPDPRKHYYRCPESEDRALSLAETCFSGLEGDRFL